MADTEHGAWDKVAQDNKAVYSGFLGFAKWGTILISISRILMAIFLV